MWWFFELMSCARFLAITGSESILRSKRVYEFIVPAVITALVALAFLTRVDIFIEGILGTITTNIFQFMVFVVPFHLAALGAFATFSAAELEKPMPGSNVQLKVWSNQDNEYFYKTLTVRQYGSLLFGYLCSIGVLYVLFYLLASVLNLEEVFGGWFELVHDVVFIAVVFFIVHFMVLTIYAITFLFDKVNRIRSV